MRDLKTYFKFKKKRKSKVTNVHETFKRYSIAIGVLVFASIIVISVLAISYLINPQEGFITALLAYTLTAAILTGFGFVYYYITIKNTYIDEIFTKTKINYESLAKQKKTLQIYNENVAEEFIEFNNYIREMNAVFANVDLTNDDLDYSKYDLEYPDPSDPKLITVESLTLNIRNFILSSRTFRNALLFFSIGEENKNITDNDYKMLIAAINKYITLENTIYAISYNRGGVLLFCPDIDSVSFFKEAMGKVVKESLIYDYTATGVNIIKVKATMVIYPYSQLDDVLTDLRYADRQGKQINIYLPDRLYETNDTFSHETLIMNNMTKTFLEFNKISVGEHDQHDAIKKACNLMKNVRINLHFENVGTIMKEEFSGKYFCTYNDCDNPEDGVFENNSVIKKDFIDAINETVDEDGSYYFSKRERCNDKLGGYLDTYGITAGHFFVIRNHGTIRSVVYFVNKNNPIHLNNYSREMLFVFSTFMSSFSKEIQDKKLLDTANMRVRDILRLSELDMYTISRETHRIVFISPGLSDSMNRVKTGEVCYKAFFGLDTPCENCPLTKGRKMNCVMRGKQCIISNVLQRKKSLWSTLLVQHGVDADYDTNRFHHDLHIYSAYSLADRLNSLYAMKVRGSLILIHIDNYEELVTNFKEDGYFNRIKHYITALKEGIKNKFDIYAYDDSTLAVLFNEDGRIDVVRNIERMFKLSNNILIEDQGFYSIEPTFLVFDFPVDNPTPTDLNRSVVRYIKENKDIYHKNDLIIASSNYVRSADRETFVLDALRNAFKTRQISIKFLPIISDDDRNIIGAEMLMRLFDGYLNVPIPADEFIEVARKHGYIGHISNYLLDLMGKIYQKYGINAFKSSGFRYFSINTDSTFLKDENFLKSINELQQTYHLPRNFLTLEVEEKDINDNFDFYREVSKKAASYDIVLVADNYTGELVSLERIKELGIGIVKVSRSVVDLIDKDVQRFNEVKEGLIDCQELGIKCVLVGIETKQHHELLKEFTAPCYRQGYYYLEPVDIDVFMDKLKQNYK